jgi:hypothetical protein
VKNEDVSRGRVRGLSQWYAIATTKNGASPVDFWGKLPAATHTLATVEGDRRTGGGGDWRWTAGCTDRCAADGVLQWDTRECRDGEIATGHVPYQLTNRIGERLPTPFTTVRADCQLWSTSSDWPIYHTALCLGPHHV